jgi:cell division septum initiation protein DivIVA
MVERASAEDRLRQLREKIATARSMPMSASCVINRGDVLTVIDDIIDHLPDEIARAQEVIDESEAKVSEGEAEAEKIVAGAREQVAELAEDSEIVKAAKERAAAIVAEAEDEAAALRKETDIFIDARMASFESVLHKTSSQVKTARARLAERSGLDAER